MASQSRWQEKGAPSLYQSPKRKRAFLRHPLLLFAFGICLAGGGFVLLGREDPFSFKKVEQEIPLIRGEEGPYKVRPENPHTHKIPHKEKTIYGHLSRQKKADVKVRMRPLPAIPTYEDPTLPQSFVQAFADESADQQDWGFLEGEEGEPQALGARAHPSPFSENKGFFTPGESSAATEKNLPEEDLTPADATTREQHAQDQALLRGAFSQPDPAHDMNASIREDKKVKEDTIVSSQILRCAEGVCVESKSLETVHPHASLGKTFYLELFQTPSQEQAQKVWGRLRQQAPDLLAAQKVFFKKIDHGRETGFRYHVLLPELSESDSKKLQESLRSRGISVSRLTGLGR